MKTLAFVAASSLLLLLNAAQAANQDVQPLPGFPGIRSNAQLFEVRGKDNKPLLKIVRADYDANRKLIIWLLEMQTDIGFYEKMTIDQQWHDVGSAVGPNAFFFDPDGVAIALREVKLSGKLYEGKKGDRIRMILELPKEGLPGVAAVDIRHP